jgi:transposase-like protein
MKANTLTSLAAFKNLDDESKRQLLTELRQAIDVPDPSPSIDELSNALRKSRFAEGILCPRCRSTAVRRFGFYRPKVEEGKYRQRYQCKDCHQTFGDLTLSPMSRTHYPDKWIPFFEYMVQGLSLRKIAKLLNIHVSTAFYWRHRILTGLRQVASSTVIEIIEATKMYMLASHKDKHQVKKQDTQKSLNHSEIAENPSTNREQICLPDGVDRNKIIISQTADCITSDNELDAVAAPYVDDITCLCTNFASCFKTLSRKKCHFHVQNVKAYHNRFKNWVVRFKGIATKYLDNYLFWHRFLDFNRRMPPHQIKAAFMQIVSKQPNEVRDIQFRPGLLALKVVI